MQKSLEKHVLSKSTFMRGRQCHKSLWLFKNFPHLRDEPDPLREQAFQHGTNVGLLAQSLFPDGVDASPEKPYLYQKSVLKTLDFISNGKTVIYEAVFQFEKVLCALDILVNTNGKWHGFEVKSSSEIKDQFILDSALQYYVITRSGIPLNDFSLIIPDKTVERNNSTNPQELFKIVPVKDRVLELQSDVENSIRDLKEVIALKYEPAIETSAHCQNPYPCDFYGHCWNTSVVR